MRMGNNHQKALKRGTCINFNPDDGTFRNFYIDVLYITLLFLFFSHFVDFQSSTFEGISK